MNECNAKRHLHGGDEGGKLTASTTPERLQKSWSQRGTGTSKMAANPRPSLNIRNASFPTLQKFHCIFLKNKKKPQKHPCQLQTKQNCKRNKQRKKGHYIRLSAAYTFIMVPQTNGVFFLHLHQLLVLNHTL